MHLEIDRISHESVEEDIIHYIYSQYTCVRIYISFEQRALGHPVGKNMSYLESPLVVP